jgi:formate dehydrogenase subunit delta
MARRVTDEKIHKLVRTANQIADNFRMLPEAESVTGVAEHLRLYWTPKMVGEIIAHAEAGRSGLNALAERGVAELKRRSAL